MKKDKPKKSAKKPKHDDKPPAVFPDPFEPAEKKPVEIKPPVPNDFNLPKEPFYFKPIEAEKVEPLPAVVESVLCVVTRIHGWGGDYLVLAAKDGHELPEVSENGTEASVTFSPPHD